MRLLIDDARVWVGTGAAPFPGKVLIDGERIAAVAPQSEPLAADGAERLDAQGRFLMPGMVEGHSHLSFVDVARGTALGELPPEDHTLLAMHAAHKLLAAEIRDAIKDGLIDGPRLLAAGPELTVTGGLGDGRLYEASCRTHNAMRKRGIRIVVGGDYGFAVNPQGTNARDLEHFVGHFGFTPSEALQAATRTGGEIMKRGHELGMIKPGYLADLLLVDGDPIADVRVMQDNKRFGFVMKGGVRYLPCQGAPHLRRLHQEIG